MKHVTYIKGYGESKLFVRFDDGEHFHMSPESLTHILHRFWGLPELERLLRETIVENDRLRKALRRDDAKLSKPRPPVKDSLANYCPECHRLASTKVIQDGVTATKDVHYRCTSCGWNYGRTVPVEQLASAYATVTIEIPSCSRDEVTRGRAVLDDGIEVDVYNDLSAHPIDVGTRIVVIRVYDTWMVVGVECV